MGKKYDLNERDGRGSFEPRFNPAFGGERINAKLGPPLPNPLARATSHENPLMVGDGYRKSRIGIPERFRKV
jgi:hypothetical protein